MQIFDEEESLKLKMDLGISRNKYRCLKTSLKVKKLPSLLVNEKKIHNAEQNCLPEGIIIRDDSARVNINDLITHTVKRILESQSKYEDGVDDNKFIFELKWGLDGSHSGNEFNMSDKVNNKYMIMSMMVPLKISSTTFNWINKKPNSNSMCRPVAILVIYIE